MLDVGVRAGVVPSNVQVLKQCTCVTVSTADVRTDLEEWGNGIVITATVDHLHGSVHTMQSVMQRGVLVLEVTKLCKCVIQRNRATITMLASDFGLKTG